jgi:hypothetical protein
MALFFGQSAYLGRSDPTYLDALCGDRECVCNEWAWSNIGEYRIENNVWNKGSISDYQQCLFIQDGDRGINAGWGWNWPGLRFNVVAHPNVMCGKNPWLSSTTPDLPIALARSAAWRPISRLDKKAVSRGTSLLICG